ncbi:MAG: tRNA nucleotidyltransferase (CCA-adding enzyme), partial [Gammaproteobacteria bacterium]
AQDLRPQKLLKLLINLDALRRPERFSDILLACEIDATGRAGMADAPYPSGDYLRHARQVANDVDVREYVQQGLSGEPLREKIDQVRIRALADVRDI